MEDKIKELEVDNLVVSQQFSDLKTSLENNFDSLEENVATNQRVDSLQQDTNGKFGRIIYVFNINFPFLYK